MMEKQHAREQVLITGTKLLFYNAKQPMPELEIDYGEGLQWAKVLGSDVVIATKVDIRGRCSLERRYLDGTTKWILTHPWEDEVVVADDDRSFTINGTTFELPNTMRAVNIQPECVFVVVYPNAEIQGRNAYRYNRDGTLKWQIGERWFDPDVPFTSMSWLGDGPLTAEGWTESRGTGAVVDYETGEIIGRADPR